MPSLTNASKMAFLKIFNRKDDQQKNQRISSKNSDPKTIPSIAVKDVSKTHVVASSAESSSKYTDINQNSQSMTQTKQQSINRTMNSQTITANHQLVLDSHDLNKDRLATTSPTADGVTGSDWSPSADRGIYSQRDRNLSISRSGRHKLKNKQRGSVLQHEFISNNVSIREWHDFISNNVSIREWKKTWHLFFINV